MHVARGLEDLRPSGEPVFAVVGVFDGLHLGHAYLLQHLVDEAGRRGARPVVITFDHHPDEVITGSAPPLLCDPEERLERLAAAGVDTTVVVHFDQRLRETPFEAFVAAIAARAPIAGFLMTPDAAFGYERQGTPEALAALGARVGFDVVVVPPFELDGEAVRSSEVRRAVASGDLLRVERLLGRPYAVRGAASRESGVERVRFGMPFSLPPTGRYAADLAPEGADAVPATVSVHDGTVVVPAGFAGESIRVAFRAPVDPAKAGM